MSRLAYVDARHSGACQGVVPSPKRYRSKDIEGTGDGASRLVNRLLASEYICLVYG